LYFYAFQIKGGRDRNRRKRKEGDDSDSDVDEADAEDARLAVGSTPASAATNDDEDDQDETPKTSKAFRKGPRKGYKWTKHSEPAPVMKGVMPATFSPTERDRQHHEKTGEVVKDRRAQLDNYKVCLKYFFQIIPNKK
jgi:hypothetical protein